MALQERDKVATELKMVQDRYEHIVQEYVITISAFSFQIASLKALSNWIYVLDVREMWL